MLRSWIDRLASWQGACPFVPHVTLLTSASGPKIKTAPLGAAVGCLQPLSIELEGLADTSEYFRCLVLVLKRSEAFDSFKSRLAAALGSTSLQASYRPHLSLLYASLGPRDRRTLRERVTIELPLRIVISDLWLVDTTSHDPSSWVPIQRWSLLSENS